MHGLEMITAVFAQHLIVHHHMHGLEINAKDWDKLKQVHHHMHGLEKLLMYGF